MSNRKQPASGRKKRRFTFVKVDVFTSRALEGNQLAVFPDARGLRDREMQALAREMNLAETTFVLPRPRTIESRQGVKVRIFTVQEELEFAGHPTLGTAFVLRKANQREVVLDLKAGRIPVRFEQLHGKLFGEMQQRDPVMGSFHDKRAAALAAGLEPEAIDPGLPIQTVSTGLAFAIVPLRSLAVIRDLSPSWKRMAEYLEATDAKFFYFVTRETEDPKARLHARMIFYNGEDPATGSAAGCCAAWMVTHGVARSDERVLIEQGLEIRRPSRIFVRAAHTGNGIVNVRVGGNVVQLMRGDVLL
ncbi:MAG TPA: PhzF family phenazine biosynthesis protein [Terriglobales bacterium]|jgi:trans-2,3-dihydro-3-hydroxyanthranilate isomerase|nr:PhzF family phenazine biosynthesis protein [Terriglobales bacterium]